MQANDEIADVYDRNLAYHDEEGEKSVCLVTGMMANQTIAGKKTVKLQANCLLSGTNYWPLTYPEALVELRPFLTDQLCLEFNATEDKSERNASASFCRTISHYKRYYNATFAGSGTFKELTRRQEIRRLILSLAARWYTILHPEWSFPQVHVTLSDLTFVQH